MLRRFAVGLGLCFLQAMAFAACPENCNTKCCTSTFGLPSCELTCQASCAAANLACGKPSAEPDLLTPNVPANPITLSPAAPPAAVAPPPIAAPPAAAAPAPVTTAPARMAPPPVTPPARVAAPPPMAPSPVAPPVARSPSVPRTPVDAAARPGSDTYGCTVDGTNQKVTITKRGSSCEAVYHKEGGRNETIWRSAYSPESCADKAREFFNRLGGRGLVCNAR